MIQTIYARPLYPAATPFGVSAGNLHRITKRLLAAKLPSLQAKCHQHADILPSVLDYLQIKPERRLLFGHSIFRSSSGRAVLHVNGHYWLVRAGAALDFAPEGTSRLFDLIKDPQLKFPLSVQSETGLALEHETKAFVQYFINGTLDNNLYCLMQ